MSRAHGENRLSSLPDELKGLIFSFIRCPLDRRSWMHSCHDLHQSDSCLHQLRTLSIELKWSDDGSYSVATQLCTVPRGAHISHLTIKNCHQDTMLFLATGLLLAIKDPDPKFDHSRVHSLHFVTGCKEPDLLGLESPSDFERQCIPVGSAMTVAQCLHAVWPNLDTLKLELGYDPLFLEGLATAGIRLKHFSTGMHPWFDFADASALSLHPLQSISISSDSVCCSPFMRTAATLRTLELQPGARDEDEGMDLEGLEETLKALTGLTELRLGAGALPPLSCLPPQLRTLVMPTLSCEQIQPLLDCLPCLRTLIISHFLLDVAQPSAAQQFAGMVPRLLSLMPETEAPFHAPYLYCTFTGGGTQQRPAPSTSVVKHLRDADVPHMALKGLGLAHLSLANRRQAAAVMECFSPRSCLSVIGCTLGAGALSELATYDTRLQQLWVSSDVSSGCVIEACKAAQRAREGSDGEELPSLQIVLNTMVKGYQQSQYVYFEWLEVPRKFERWLVDEGKENARKVSVRVRDEESWVIY